MQTSTASGGLSERLVRGAVCSLPLVPRTGHCQLEERMFCTFTAFERQLRQGAGDMGLGAVLPLLEFAMLSYCCAGRGAGGAPWRQEQAF